MIKLIKIRPLLETISPYQAGRRASEVRTELGLDDLIKLSSNESPFPPVKLAQRAMRLAVANINRYPESGCALLTAKISRLLGMPEAGIIVGNGSNELIRLIAQVVTDPGDELVMATPSFVVYPLVAKLFQAKAVEVPLKDQRHDLEAMADAVTGKTKIVFVCNPNNPTGTIVGREAVARFIKRIPPDVLIVFDEAYHEFVTDPDYISAMDFAGECPNIIVLRTFSKIYGMAGARIGYGFAPAEVVGAMHKVREPFNVNMIAQVGAHFSLDCPDEIEDRRQWNDRERRYLEDELIRLGLAFAPTQANFIYVDLGKDADQTFTELKKLGIIVRNFSDGNFVRITIGKAGENRKLIAALEKMSGKT